MSNWEKTWGQTKNTGGITYPIRPGNILGQGQGIMMFGILYLMDR